MARSPKRSKLNRDCSRYGFWSLPGVFLHFHHRPYHRSGITPAPCRLRCNPSHDRCESGGHVGTMTAMFIFDIGQLSTGRVTGNGPVKHRVWYIARATAIAARCRLGMTPVADGIKASNQRFWRYRGPAADQIELSRKHGFDIRSA